MHNFARGTRRSAAVLATVLMAVVMACDDTPTLPSMPPSSAPAPILTLKPPPEAGVAQLGPHGGRLFEFDDGSGAVEWVVNEEAPGSRIYFIDAAGNPLAKLERVSLWITSPTGPQPVSLEPCRDQKDPTAANACRTTSDENLVAPPANGVLRFHSNGEPRRVFVTEQRSTTRPAYDTPLTGDTTHARRYTL